MGKSKYGKWAAEVFRIESRSISDLVERLDKGFDYAVDSILNSMGRVVVSGVGKSGLIGRKISATFASTGTPSFFMHPVEAFHGDLGMLAKKDVFLCISYSGETEELLRLLPFVRERGLKIVGLSGNKKSTLAQHCDAHLDISVYKEACPLELAPTSSTTATLAMGDALAVSLMKARNFQPEDFALYHPGGSLGRKLLTTVESCMFSKNLPLVKPGDGMKQVINTMSSGRLGLAVVMEKNSISGIITDGDLRRAMDKYEASLVTMKAKQIMTASPRVISKRIMMAEAEALMSKHKITSLLVGEKGKLEGIVQIYSIER